MPRFFAKNGHHKDMCHDEGWSVCRILNTILGSIGLCARNINII